MTNFWKALEMVDMSQPKIETEYRLYYDPETGNPLFYTSSNEPGTYIVIDKEAYDASNYHCTVKDGKIINLNIVRAYRKLVPSNTGITTHEHNVMIISEKGQQWALKTYEN